MPPQPTPAEPAPVPTDAERFCGILREIIDIGLRHIRATDPANPPAEPGGGPHEASGASAEAAADTYERVSRSVRRSIMLFDQLANPTPPAAKPAPADPAAQRTAKRKDIIRGVEDTIGSKAPEPAHDALKAELQDRMDSEDFEHDLATRPTADIITNLCRDLGIAAFSQAGLWQRRTPDDVNDLYARAAQPAPAAGRPPRPTPTLVPTPPREPKPRQGVGDGATAGLSGDMRLALALLGDPPPVHDPPS